MFMMRGRVSPQEILTTLVTNIVVAKNKDQTTIDSFFYHNIDVKILFLSVRDTLRDTLMRTALSVLLSTIANWPIRLRHYCNLR